MNSKDRRNLERAYRYAAKAQTYLTRIAGDYSRYDAGLGGADNHLLRAIGCIYDVGAQGEEESEATRPPQGRSKPAA